MHKYPVGIQDFRKIREGNYLYVDKTRLIHTLIETGSYYFLSRPRRFGKSLLLSTIKEIFNGNKDIFRGLWIENNWDWNTTYPVIHLRFSKIDYQKLGLYDALSNEMDFLAGQLNVQLTSEHLKGKFEELIRKAAINGPVVILIDEYDKPIIDYLDNLATAEENRSICKSFYSVLKDADEYIKLLVMTGVTRFAKISIFSDLNNLEDISLSKNMNDLVGITQAELETNFGEELEELAILGDLTRTELIQKVKQWYNGYSWGGGNTLYNPFSLLSLMKQKEFKNFWFATGSPSFLIKQIQKRKEFKFEDLHLSENALANFDIQDPLSVPLLFQTGYVTIKEYNTEGGFYTLDYPNKEVEQSLLDALLSAYRQVFPGDSLVEANDLRKALQINDFAKVIAALNTLISTVPYDHWKAESESIFHIIVHLAFKKIGVDVESEVHSSKGRCDVVIKTATHIYAIELKLDSTSQKALEQIVQKEYLKPYMLDARIKTAVGINFSSVKREVDDYTIRNF